eukprot:11614757-Heterocapsa_arctica.AAC.1
MPCHSSCSSNRRQFGFNPTLMVEPEHVDTTLARSDDLFRQFARSSKDASKEDIAVLRTLLE